MDSKRIKILTSGVIPVKGFFCGPILTPHRETISNIYRLISAGINVVEVLDNGSEVKLTMMNYNIDNNPHAYVNKKPVGSTPVVFIEPETIEEPVEIKVEDEKIVDEPVEEVKLPVIETPVEDEKEEEPELPVVETTEEEQLAEETEEIVEEADDVVTETAEEEPELPVEESEVETTEEEQLAEETEEIVKEAETPVDNKENVIKTDVKVGTLNNERRDNYNNNNKKNKNKK